MKFEDLKYKSIIGVLKMLALLPLPLLYGIMMPVRLICYNLLHYRKKVVEGNLRIAFPEKDDNEIRSIVKDFYKHLFDIFPETIKLLHISDGEMMQRLRVVNPEIIDKILGEGKPIVLLLGHLGNWEWIPSFSVVIKNKVRFGEVYKRLHDKTWNKVMYRIRDRWPTIFQIEQKETVRKLLGWNREGPWMTGFIADQRPNSENVHHTVNFFGKEVLAMVGAETIGKKTGAEFFYIDVSKPGRGHYEITFKPIKPKPSDESNFPFTDEYYRLLEESIRREPAIWLWSHKRWKGIKRKGELQN